MKSISIFRPGKHVATSGAALSFSDADLAATAKAYDPAKHEAPIVIGHPKADLPAYGWVKGLTYADGALEARPDQVDAQFAELVKAGRFKKISASFYIPGAANNPVPEVYYLRHVGFLGAQPPAVKGLKAIAFGDAEEGTIEFGDWSDTQNASLWRSVREWLIAKFGLEEADKAVPGYAVDTLQAFAAQPEPAAAAAASGVPNFSEKETQMDKVEADRIIAENARLAAQVAQFTERENAIKAQEAAARRAGIVSFVEGLVTEGRALPVYKDGLVSLLVALPADASIEFGEGEKAVKQPTLDWLKGYFAAQPKLVSFGEAGADRTGAATVEFAAPPGYQVDRDRLEIHNKALAYQAKNKVDYVTAVRAVGGA